MRRSMRGTAHGGGRIMYGYRKRLISILMSTCFFMSITTNPHVVDVAYASNEITFSFAQKKNGDTQLTPIMQDGEGSAPKELVHYINGGGFPIWLTADLKFYRMDKSKTITFDKGGPCFEEMLKVYGNEATYSFLPSVWDLRVVMEYVLELEDSIRYVKDWFGYEYLKPLQVELSPGMGPYPEWANALAISSGDKISLFWCMEYPPIAGVHEAVHSLSMVMGEFSDIFLSDKSFECAFSGKAIYYFEEGLAEAIRILYSDAGLLSYYDSLAVETMNEYISLKKKNALPFEYHDSEYPYLYTFASAASFVSYLLMQGTKEDFKIIRNDISKMKAVYGKNLDEMIKGWRKHLGVLW